MNALEIIIGTIAGLSISVLVLIVVGAVMVASERKEAHRAEERKEGEE